MEVIDVPISRLKFADYNPRVHPEKAIDKLVKSIEHYGFTNPVLVQRGSWVIMAGHLRVKAAKRHGLKSVPVILHDFDDAKAMAYNVADNRLQDETSFDFASLADVLLDLDTGFFDMELTGFDLDQIEDIMTWTPEPGEVREDDEFEGQVPAKPKTRPGDLYTLGRHRLICGDATDLEVVARLMDSRPAQLVFTDPPYGVDYAGGTKPREKMEGDTTPDLYEPAAKMAFRFSDTKAAFYLWHAGTKAIPAAEAVAVAGYQVRSTLVWNKNHAQFGAIGAQYKHKHEPALYCFKRGKAPRWHGPTNEVTVWDIDRAVKNEFHPTQKPIGLAGRAITNSSKPGDVVMDLYAGSGSTMLAADQLGRICYLAELEPGYCDVIVERYAAFLRQGPGQLFSKVIHGSSQG